MSDIKKILTERNIIYGEYASNAALTQDLKATLRGHPNWQHLPDATREALEMIAHKVSRVVNGSKLQPDTWDDICGYSLLAKAHTHNPTGAQIGSSADK